MKRSKLGATDPRQGSRLGTDFEQSEAEDPIAAAAQAKQARTGIVCSSLRHEDIKCTRSDPA